MTKYLALGALFLTLSPAYAGEVAEFQAKGINLQAFEGVVYYTNAADGYHVVATIAEGERGMPVRFEVTLADAQKMTISVPGKPGEKSHIIEVSRTGGKLMLVEPDLTQKTFW
jgi:hypothetical protein